MSTVDTLGATDADAVPDRVAPGPVGTPARYNLWRRLGLYRLPKLSLFGLFLIVLLVAVAIFPHLFASQDPNAQDLSIKLQGPSGAHWFGTDIYGRDLYTRLIYGTRISMIVGVGSVVLGMAVGMPLGVIAGFFGGKVERILMWIVDVFLAFPSLILALLFVALYGGSLWNVTAAIAISVAPGMIRIAHGPAMGFKARDYVRGSIAFGASPWWVMRKHLWPNLRAEMLILATLAVSGTIQAEAGLSFLGLGVGPPTATWGGALQEGTGYLQTHPLYSVIPGLAILVAVLAFNLFGDGLRDVLDPRNASRIGV